MQGFIASGTFRDKKDIEIPSRHLGLTLDEKFRFEEFADRIAASIEQYIQVDNLLNICSKETISVQPKSAPVSSCSSRKLKIAVAHDEAFNFTYQENINQLKECGDVEFFSPLRHFSAPLSADLLYLPGGYPEFFLSPLSANKSMIQSIRDYALSGGRVLAECGGMMYLCNSITGMDGISYPMAGVLDQKPPWRT
jgi:cobyrinic acid a,c-diamide synthase